MSRSEAKTARPPAGLRGMVDNFAEGRVYGWAWNPGRPGERLRILLRHGRQVVAEVLAADERPDLEAAGVGDGHHAFKLALPASLGGRLNELSLVARAADGTEMPIPIRGARRAAVAAAPVTADLTLAARLETLEAWCGRLDGQLAALGTTAPAAVRRLDPWQLGLGALLGGLAAVALSVTWLGADRLLGAG